MNDISQLSSELESSLGLSHSPLAITFCEDLPDSVPTFDRAKPSPTPGGRTGSVAAGCVFWFEASKQTFATDAADHANCSVGSVTHGFKTLDEVAGNEDVAALLDSEWVSTDAVFQIPVVQDRPNFVVYGPLAESSSMPDVVLLRITPRQLMVLSDALEDLRIEGKPQCHIIPVAKEQNVVIASVGCQLSRVRTSMPNSEMTCAIPGKRLDEVVDLVTHTSKIDQTVAAYASTDMKRFNGS